MMLGCRAMSLRSVLVVFGGLVVFVSCHLCGSLLLLPAVTKPPARQSFL
jgi:hypothetical protein